MTTRTLTGPFALAAFLCFTAFAAGAAELPAKTVFYGDLNLSSPAGAGVLYARIKAAAKRWTRSPIDGTRRHNMAGLERGAAVS